ncbi:YfhO family protein [Adhaeribacter sp. BT258]|uniref:YfhO family protein n=1 Tax=Adhaeribacter terrigena TaxID=2793070 RepID=A0ABS1C5A2_9BACT|nr:YfhO family protein [Adhaeribacter terrigena]MBK0404362.1 YfhO family protein [Adhaeribacter terrigena]
MNRTFSFKHHLLPHIIAVLFFFGLSATYFSPILFEGKALPQNDILQHRGSSQEATAFREKTGEEALWTNSMFSGMPTYLISTKFPGDLMKFAHQAITFNLPAMVANVFLALVCAYILFVALGMSTWLSIAGAIAFAFTSYNLIILEAGHNTKSLAIAYIPLVLAGLIITFRKGRRNFWLGAAFFAFGLAMHIRMNHLQITYYLLLIVLIFGIVELIYAIKEKWLGEYFKRVTILALGAMLAVGVSFGRVYATYEYGKYSIRGKSEIKPLENAGATATGSGLDRDYAFNWSYGVGETITLLIPDFYGGASTYSLNDKSETYQALLQVGAPEGQARDIVKNMPMYWGDQPFTSGPVYVGAIICFLFVLGLFLVNKRIRYWLLAATILSILLAWGKNFDAFNYFMFDHFPGYNKFRAVSMALVIAQVTIPLLGILALYEVLYGRNKNVDYTKAVLYSAGITAGFALLAMIVGSMSDFIAPADAQLQSSGFPVQVINALREDRAGMMRGDTFRTIIFILLAAGVLYFYLKGKLSATVASLVVGALILIDLWSLDKRYLKHDAFQRQIMETHFQPSPADQQILQDKDLSYRVINLQNPFNDARTSYFHKSIGGYHGAKLRRYQDLIDRHISQNNFKVLNMLNTRYFITGDPKMPVQRNPEALGNAWFVSSVKPVNNPDEEIAALKDFDPKTEAVVDISKFPVTNRSFNAAGSTVKLTSYSPNELTYDVNAAQNGLIVFSEIFYQDGWNAYIDGKLTPHLRANYVLRALEVPAGQHKVEFKFEPKEYTIGNTLTLISSILLYAVIIGAIVFAVKTKPEENQPIV